jgi:hypothetical protein
MAAVPEYPAPDWPAIAAELCAMSRDDEAVREELARDGSLDDGYHPRMAAVHSRNAERLEAILDRHGWPDASRVGPQAAEAAWLILQHAIGRPSSMRRGLAQLGEAVSRGEASAVHQAMLEDRIRSFEGSGQRYATQFDWDATGQLSPLPIEDPGHVDERRRAIGLPPLAVEVERRRTAAASSKETPPSDPEARRRRYEAWLVEVGWRA